MAAQWGRLCPPLSLEAEVPPTPPPRELPPPQPWVEPPSANPWQVKASARTEGGSLTLEMVMIPPAPDLAQAVPPPPKAPVAPDPAPTEPLSTPESRWEDDPEQMAEALPPPLPPPDTVRTVRVTPLRRFWGNVPSWQWAFWLGLMTIAVGGGLIFGRWLTRQLPELQNRPAAPPPSP
ncbi:MAG: hypothetical protein HC918_11550, partial [Oscillatoriales cyanobacterium SM2_1_8]|nr:hypothetical protein [Oscillatoriales cyanobacterium SM2_1_8]